MDGTVLNQEVKVVITYEQLVCEIERIAREERTRLIRFITKYLYKFEHYAEDVFQETLCQALRFAKSFNGFSTVITWIHGIALNLARNWLRVRIHNGRATYTISDLEIDDESGFRDKQYGFNEADCPSHTLTIKQAMNRLRTTIETAHTGIGKGIDAFLLHEMHGLTYEEIARIHHVPVGTIRSRISRARIALRDALVEHYGYSRYV